jgi:hypothetical protein
MAQPSAAPFFVNVVSTLFSVMLAGYGELFATLLTTV